MYFNKENSFYHGIMFHHFHDEKIHSKSQGSISRDEFYKIIKHIGLENILNANEFYLRLKDNKLENKKVCITFDDCIKAQIDVALPVLEDLKIKAFFFVYTSLFDNEPDFLEIYRHFRSNYFNNIDDFYKEFFKLLDKDFKTFLKDNNKFIENKKSKFPFYSTNDINFRLIRDSLLSKEEYKKIMLIMFKEKKFEPKKYYSNLFFSEKDINQLNSLEHIVGLHSHNHHTMIENLSYEEQKNEYIKCIKKISEIISKPQSHIKVMSHPCGSYNHDTLKILKNLGIDLGFKASMHVEKDRGMKKINNSTLEIARKDHSEIIKMIK